MRVKANVWDPYNQVNRCDITMDMKTYPTDKQEQWYWAQYIRERMPFSTAITWGHTDDLMMILNEFAQTRENVCFGWFTLTIWEWDD